MKIDAKQLSGEAFRPPEGDRCPHHEQCRDDLGRPQEMLCGYHSHKRWERCYFFKKYEKLHSLTEEIIGQFEEKTDASNSV